MKIPMHEIGKLLKTQKSGRSNLQKRPRKWADQIRNHMRVQNIPLKGCSLFKSIKHTLCETELIFTSKGRRKLIKNEKTKLIVKFGYELRSLKATFWTQKKVIGLTLL